MRSQIDRMRREDTLAWMAHSVWISTLGLVIASAMVLFGVGACVAALLNRVPALVIQAHPGLVVAIISCAFGLAVPAGVVAYGMARAQHPDPIRRGRRIHGLRYGFVVGCAGLLAASVIAMPWSFPPPEVLVDTSQQVSTLARDHQIVMRSVYQEPSGHNLYFEVTIGAWIVTPFNSIRPGSTYDKVVRAAEPRPFASLTRVATAIGSRQTAALRNRMSHLWELAASLCLVAIGAGVIQRRRWSKPILAPPVDDTRVRQIVAAHLNA